MFMIMYNSPVSGLAFVGPFVAESDAVAYCQDDEGPYEIVPISAPREQCGSLYDLLSNVADDMEGAADFLYGENVTPCEQGSLHAYRLKLLAQVLRNPAVRPNELEVNDERS